MDHAQSTPFRHASHPSPLRSRLVELSQQQQPEPGFETLEGKHISGVPLSTLDIVQGVVLPERHTEKNQDLFNRVTMAVGQQDLISQPVTSTATLPDVTEKNTIPACNKPPEPSHQYLPMTSLTQNDDVQNIQRLQRLLQLQALLESGHLPPDVAASVATVLSRARDSGLLSTPTAPLAIAPVGAPHSSLSLKKSPAAPFNPFMSCSPGVLGDAHGLQGEAHRDPVNSASGSLITSRHLGEQHQHQYTKMSLNAAAYPPNETGRKMSLLTKDKVMVGSNNPLSLSPGQPPAQVLRAVGGGNGQALDQQLWRQSDLTTNSQETPGFRGAGATEQEAMAQTLYQVAPRASPSRQLPIQPVRRSLSDQRRLLQAELQKREMVDARGHWQPSDQPLPYSMISAAGKSAAAGEVGNVRDTLPAPASGSSMMASVGGGALDIPADVLEAQGFSESSGSLLSLVDSSDMDEVFGGMMGSSISGRQARSGDGDLPPPFFKRRRGGIRTRGGGVVAKSGTQRAGRPKRSRKQAAGSGAMGVMAPLSSVRPMRVAERLGPGARRLGPGGSAQRRLGRIVDRLRNMAKACGLLTGAADAVGEAAEIAQAELWIKDALRRQHEGGAKQGVRGSFVTSQGFTSNSPPDQPKPAGNAACATVTRAQVLMVALMSTGLAAASVAELHAVLLGWLREGVRDAATEAARAEAGIGPPAGTLCGSGGIRSWGGWPILCALLSQPNLPNQLGHATAEEVEHCMVGAAGEVGIACLAAGLMAGRSEAGGLQPVNASVLQDGGDESCALTTQKTLGCLAGELANRKPEVVAAYGEIGGLDGDLRIIGDDDVAPSPILNDVPELTGGMLSGELEYAAPAVLTPPPPPPPQPAPPPVGGPHEELQLWTFDAPLQVQAEEGSEGSGPYDAEKDSGRSDRVIRALRIRHKVMSGVRATLSHEIC